MNYLSFFTQLKILIINSKQKQNKKKKNDSKVTSIANRE